MVGAAMATIFSFVIMATFTNISSKKYFPLRYDWIRIAKYSGTWCIAVAAASVLRTEAVLLESLKAFAIMIFFVVANYLFFNNREKEVTRNAIKKIAGRLNMSFKT